MDVHVQAHRRQCDGSHTPLADVVAASAQVAATSARTAKIATLADLLRSLDPAEVPVVVGFLSGLPRQGRVGVGYRMVSGLEVEPAAAPSLTVADLDRLITEVEAATGSGSAAGRRELLAALLRRATEPEAAFIRRLFTGALRQGALAGLMAEAVAKAAGVRPEPVRRALMLSGDLPGTAAIALSEGEAGLESVGFELFRPVQPMLASTAPSVEAAVAELGEVSVEWKLDGIRIQIHRRGDDVRVYTRNLNEITATLPGVVAAVGRLPVEQAVLDGEGIWIGGDGRPAAFQDTVSLIDAGAPPEGIVTFLFDLLHVDGEDLLDTPLRERRARLETLAPELVAPGVLTADAREAERVLEEALAAGHEGVVVKDAGSSRLPGRPLPAPALLIMTPRRT